MHGLTNRALECFVRSTYGNPTWSEVVRRAQLDVDTFESMTRYDDAVTEALIAAAAQELDKPRDILLEDVGTYLVSHPSTEPVRRLLRFGGLTYLDFLHSLEDLPGRARLAVPDLDLPQLELIDRTDGAATLLVRSDVRGYAHVLVGMLRAMADDYGALVLLDHDGERGGVERVQIQIHDMSFAEGRGFALA